MTNSDVVFSESLKTELVKGGVETILRLSLYYKSKSFQALLWHNKIPSFYNQITSPQIPGGENGIQEWNEMKTSCFT